MAPMDDISRQPVTETQDLGVERRRSRGLKPALDSRLGDAMAEEWPEDAVSEDAAEEAAGEDSPSRELPIPSPEQAEAPAEAAAETETETTAETTAEADSEQPSPADLPRVLCALLLASKESQSYLRLAQSCQCTQQEVKQALLALEETLASSGLPLEVCRAGESVRLLTQPDVYPYLQNLKARKKADRLSPAALETLAVVAYRQPVMRAEIEAIRGVQVGPILRTLLDHNMVRITGRADVPGRPLQYGTTQQFLERFSLASVQELPSVKEFKSL